MAARDVGGGGAVRARERRAVFIGTTIVLAALALTYGILPAARRWQARDAEIRELAAAADSLAAIGAAREALEARLGAIETSLSSRGRGVLRARSGALAASALQSFLQEAADASRLVVTRLDVTAPDGTGGASESATAPGTIPGTLAAYGDVHGLAALLRALDQGSVVVDVERLVVQQNSALRGAPDVVQVTLLLRAPVTIK